VLALDVVPVATREWFDGYDDFPWVKEATGGKVLPTLGGDGIDYESIATAKPDVIFAVYETIDRPTYDRLSQIAPTVIQPDDHPDEETPWDVQLLLTGKAGQGAFDSHLSGALSCSGPEALLYALDRLVPQLANAVNGRPVADLSHA
ncbi:ABC transporter substrate-binding protein, partial [Pseudonocardia sp.]|uniref:ABC transporter substrate-binding protein n=1 Tax=Pseudonocardia sp. TaxID=60912 RepID=UPI003D146BAC